MSTTTKTTTGAAVAKTATPKPDPTKCCVTSNRRLLVAFRRHLTYLTLQLELDYAHGRSKHPIINRTEQLLTISEQFYGFLTCGRTPTHLIGESRRNMEAGWKLLSTVALTIGNKRLGKACERMRLVVEGEPVGLKTERVERLRGCNVPWFYKRKVKKADLLLRILGEYAGELKRLAEQMPAQAPCKACIKAEVEMESTESRVARRGRRLGEKDVPAEKGEKSGVYEPEL